MQMSGAQPSMTQMSLRRGLKHFQHHGTVAVTKELQQLHDRQTFIPVHPDNIPSGYKDKILESHLFLEQKRDMSVKGRLVAGGNTQRDYVDKCDVGASTVATESIMMTAIIEAKELRDVAMVDIPNAFVQTKVLGDIYMKLRGELADQLILMAPTTYKSYAITKKNGQTVLYVRLNKALYGIMQAAILFYKKLSADLLTAGFTINAYDPCVENKVIDGSQFTIIWHVDDLKMSHRYPKVVSAMIECLRGKYATDEHGNQFGTMSVQCGAKHTYLGMTLTYRKMCVEVGMVEYIKTLVAEFPDDKKSNSVSTPASLVLFETHPSTPLLPAAKAKVFHRFVAKLLYASKRSHPDIATAVAFLCTRVQQPSNDDWNKLLWCIRYLNQTTEMVLTLTADRVPVIKWWVDASYAVHHDLRSHTGATFTLGGGSIYSCFRKQKLNTRSSTEAELVGVDDILSHILWTNYFLEEQGYTSNGAILYQDNQSAILLASNNGHWSKGKSSKNIAVHYFY